MREEDTQLRHLVAEVARQLGEHESGPLAQLRRVITHLGVAATQTLLADTLHTEANGGLLLPDGSRRRTPGGVFFFLARQRLPYAVRQDIFFGKRPRPKRKQGAPSAASIPPPPLPLDAIGNIVAELGTTLGSATVKITVIGRPTNVVDRDAVVVTGFVHDKQPTLPKGLPPLPPPTRYVVLIAKKQWTKVADQLKDPEDVLIVEGTPSYTHQHPGITVYATNVTTKKLQAAKRVAPAAGDEP